jgi:trehalose 6-phosphate phosphatase
MVSSEHQPTDWQDALPTLRSLVIRTRLGIVTDVDGTLSPIVPDPDAAQITQRSRELLQALRAHLTVVAVVSGRSAEDVRMRVGLPELTYLGNHGLERWEAGQLTIAPAAAQFRPALEAALRDLSPRQVPGMQIEDKGATLSIHYRRTAEPEAVSQQLGPVIREIAARHNLTFFQGRMVFELRPPIEINKGTAFRSLIRDHNLEAAIYLGDDTTDVDALQMARQLRQEHSCYCFGLGVVSPGTPEAVREAADFLVSGVPGVESFLDWLLTARSASST